MVVTFNELVIYFFVYSFIGYCCEVVYCSLGSKKFVNRGFLNGPYCPIYGFGAIAVLLFLHPFANNPVLLFVMAMFVTTVLEYITSYILERLFNLKWWDYSDKKYNINGRVCLLNSILFGGLSLILVYLVNPFFVDIIYPVNSNIKQLISSLIIISMSIDFIFSVNSLINLENKLKEIYNILKTLKEYEDEYYWFDSDNIKSSIRRLKRIAENNNDTKLQDLVIKFENLTIKGETNYRVLKSYPKISYKNSKDILNLLKGNIKEKFDEFETKIETTGEKLKTKADIFSSNISDKMDNKKPSFATGFNFYKFFWIFFLSSVLGFIVETIFCFVTRGYIESRQGLIYGPFSQVYGIGAVIMILFLHKLEKKRDGIIFFASAVIGGIFEFFCSLFQEIFFGTVSWEYSHESYSIGGGRTSLLYMLFWGILGVILIKEVYPRASRFIEKIPNKQGYVFTWIMIIFLTYDIFISSAAVVRWVKRDSGIEPKNKFEIFIDNRYPDDFMKEIYPNMVIVE